MVIVGVVEVINLARCVIGDDELARCQSCNTEIIMGECDERHTGSNVFVGRAVVKIRRSKFSGFQEFMGGVKWLSCDSRLTV